MSRQSDNEPDCPRTEGGPVEALIIPRARDLGGFEVRRALPAKERRLVGPFIFFDQAGPAEFVTGKGVDVRPHPHIGLATVTYLYKGEFQHRDSLGTNQMIHPGAVNWMTAGYAVTHSERTSEETRKAPHSLFGIQTWVALPLEAEEIAPSFEHHAADALPRIGDAGVDARLIVGRAYGETAPATTYSDMFYVDAALEPGARMPLPDDHEDRGLYVVEGSVEIAGDVFESGRMLVFRPGDAITVSAGAAGARLMLLGGATLEGPRHVWWNFVASSQEKIDAAAEAWRESERTGDWENGRFTLPPGDDQEFIPAPER
ncbi:MAG: pirin family protein [Maricaulaceae bacterium]